MCPIARSSTEPTDLSSSLNARLLTEAQGVPGDLGVTKAGVTLARSLSR